MPEDSFQLFSRFFMFYIPLLFSLCVHEWAHARIALFKGDTLARDQGRLSLNPFVHADLLGTFILPLMSIFSGLPVFGWARPVPVDPSALKDPRKDMFWIAFAGPLSNFCLALISGLALAFVSLMLSGEVARYLSSLLGVMIYMNLLLGFFNLIPLHPLDGAKVVARFLPIEWNLRLELWESYTSWILIALFVTGGFSYLVFPAYWLAAEIIVLATTSF